MTTASTLPASLAGLTGGPRTDLERWRAQIEAKRTAQTQLRVRHERARLTDLTRTRETKTPSRGESSTAPPSGPAPRPPRAMLTRSRVLEAWETHADLEHVAQQLDLTITTVRRHLRAAGILVPRPERPTQPRATRRPPAPVKAPAEEVASSYLDGSSVADLAHRHRVSEGTIRARLRDAGVTTRGREHNDDLGQRIAELYLQGSMGHLSIARALGCSTSTVARYLKLRNIAPLRGRGHRLTRPAGSKAKTYPADLVEQVRQLAEIGMTQAQIAEHTSSTRKVIWRLMHRHDITPRPAVAAHPRDGAVDLKARMHQAGVTSREVRTWAERHGLEISTRGLPPRQVLDAYLATTGPAAARSRLGPR